MTNIYKLLIPKITMHWNFQEILINRTDYPESK